MQATKDDVPYARLSASDAWTVTSGWEVAALHKPDRRQWRTVIVTLVLVGALTLILVAPDGGAELLAVFVGAAPSVVVHEALHAVPMKLQGGRPRFAVAGTSALVYGDGRTMSRRGALTMLLMPYYVLVPLGLLGLAVGGLAAWAGTGVLFLQVLGSFSDMYAAHRVLTSPRQWRWADTRTALVALQHTGDQGPRA